MSVVIAAIEIAAARLREWPISPSFGLRTHWSAG